MLNDDQINRLVAEAMGIPCWHEWNDPVGHGFKIKFTCSGCGQKRYRSHIPANPDYCNDLTFAFEFVGKLVAEGWNWEFRVSKNFTSAITYHPGRADNTSISGDSNKLPRAICIAGLKATGRWPEGE